MLLSALIVSGPSASYAKKKTKEAEKKETVKKTPYEKLFKDKQGECAKGMFTIHKVGGKVYFEIPTAMLGREMLFGSTISEISDNSDGLVGEKPAKPLLVRFVQQDTTVVLQEFTARASVIDPGYENIESALEINKIPTTFETFAIKAYAPDSSLVIDAT